MSHPKSLQHISYYSVIAVGLKGGLNAVKQIQPCDTRNSYLRNSRCQCGFRKILSCLLKPPESGGLQSTMQLLVSSKPSRSIFFLLFHQISQFSYSFGMLSTATIKYNQFCDCSCREREMSHQTKCPIRQIAIKELYKYVFLLLSMHIKRIQNLKLSASVFISTEKLVLISIFSNPFKLSGCKRIARHMH